MKYLLIGLLKAYRVLISPLYGNVCRYYPSCSAYALRAVQVHGAAKGSWLAARRVLRCHPWSSGGYDPVPGTPEFAEEMRAQAAGAVTLETTSFARRAQPPHELFPRGVK
jgi:putative membrane protein insertion efficiency factor